MQLKRKNIYHFVILIIGIWIINSCSVNHSLEADKFAKVYMPLARNKAETYTLVTGIDTSITITYGATYGGPGEPNKNINVSFSVAPALVDSFNYDNSTSYKLLPDKAYKLGKASTIIPAGESFSSRLTLKFIGNIDIEEDKYLLPVTMQVNSENVPINENLKTTYFLITTNSVIPFNSPIVITGVVANTWGSDSPVAGTVKYGKFTIKRSGFEYIQLMALRDIDFSETPFSVVVGRHYGSIKKGWASGESTSFKFNLTEGYAEQGTFFYVGGAARRIDGYRHSGLSRDISEEANWIRSIPTNLGKEGAVAGDGFGYSTSGLLTNSSEATGIAVFEGTKVTETSVPLDAIFYGSSVGDALQANNGYLVPDNDLYDPVNKKTGAPQPLFGQGTNTAMLEYHSNLMQFGGVFMKGAILVPRTSSHQFDLKKMTIVEEIENGPHVTKFIKR